MMNLSFLPSLRDWKASRHSWETATPDDWEGEIGVGMRRGRGDQYGMRSGKVCG